MRNIEKVMMASG